MDLDLDVELAWAREVVGEAASLVVTGAGRDLVRVKGDGSPVTAVDVAVHDLVAACLGQRRVGHGLVSEEGGGVPARGSAPVWVLDPLDGTVPYAAGLALATVSLALVVDGDPVVAVVADPFTARTWWARRGSGTWLEERGGGARQVQVSPRTGLDGALVELSCPEKAGLLAALDGARPVVLWSGVRAGAAVADGSFAAWCYGPGQPWDVAAAALLVREAGGVVSALDGGRVALDRPCGRLVMAAPGVCGEVVAAWRGVLGQAPGA